MRHTRIFTLAGEAAVGQGKSGSRDRENIESDREERERAKGRSILYSLEVEYGECEVRDWQMWL